MKLLIAPDSFKGTLTAGEVCAIVARAFGEAYPEAVIHTLPLSDGGEGMAEAWQAVCGGEMREAQVSGPYGEVIQARWLLLKDGTAVLETASCAGLELARPRGLNPEKTSTRGLGELMLSAYEAGARRVVLGLGGSSTNDAGCGMAHALGWEFLDERGGAFCPVGGTLGEIARIVPPVTPFPLPVTAACDVRAPLFGPQGAAYVYAPQKGADAAMAGRLDAGLRHLGGRMQAGYREGDGAAGGLGFGVRVFCGGALRPGVDMLLDQAGFDAMLDGADLVITGEGRMDAQTAQGKAPWGVLLRARAKGVPVIGVCGCLGKRQGALLEAGFAGLYPAGGEAGAFDIQALRAGCRGELYRAAGRAAREWPPAQCT